MADRSAHVRVQPLRVVPHVLGIDGETRCERLAGRFGRGAQRIERRPRPFRVYVVRGHRRDATPIVDPGADELRQLARLAQVRRRLDVHVRAEDDPSGGDSTEKQLGVTRLGGVHRGAGLREEVLDDDLLHVTVARVRCTDGDQRVDPFGLGLTESNKDPRGERHPRPAGRVQGFEPTGRGLVRRPMVRTAGFVEPIRQRLEHHSLRWTDRPQTSEFDLVEGAGIGVGKQTGLGQHRARRGHEIVDRRAVPVGLEPVLRDRVALLGRFAEGEQRLVTASGRAGASDVEDSVDVQVRMVQPGRRFGEGAVPAAVPAQHRERDEHLRREGHPRAVPGVAQRCRLLEEIGGGGVLELAGVGAHRRQPTRGPIRASSVPDPNRATVTRVTRPPRRRRAR